MLAKKQIQPGDLDAMRPSLYPVCRLAVEIWNRCNAAPTWAQVREQCAELALPDVDALWHLQSVLRR